MMSEDGQYKHGSVSGSFQSCDSDLYFFILFGQTLELAIGEMTGQIASAPIVDEIVMSDRTRNKERRAQSRY